MEMKNRSVHEEHSKSPIPSPRLFKTVSHESPEGVLIYENTEPFVALPQECNTMDSEVTEEVPINENVEPTSTPPKIFLWTQLLAAFAVSMGLLLNGFAFAYSYHGLSSLLSSPLNTDRANDIDWTIRSMPWATIIGSLLGAPLVTYVGRRYSIMGACVPYFIGWILIASAPNLYFFIAGRILCGLCAGIVSSASPVYIVETVQPQVRGALGLLPSAFKSGGVLLAYSAGAYLDWSKMAYIGAVLSVIYALLMLATPESPRWYIAKGRTHDAREALQWLRGKKTNVDKEMQDLTQFQIETDKTNGTALKQMFYMANIPTVFIALTLMLFQQLNGNSAMFYYAHKMYQKSSGIDDVQLFTIIISITSIVSMSIAVVVVDLIGRKIMLYISSGTNILSLVILAAYAYRKEVKLDISVGWLPEACVVLYVVGTAIGNGSIPWLMLGEILPLKIRGTAASLITGIFWAGSYYITSSFQYMINYTTVYSAVLIYVVIRLVELLFILFCVPETRGKSLEEIEINLTQRVKNVK
ncbi:hypothetical protein K1T71_010584 [Dendrolimus kikuchii]|uniref:Uncharacterized protein n=1 Tax=Dendrolimus kikuchii TaxID=765133 RepID=A0ACC1CPA4_9NEOP|nr:hypothetical protein K1T71_010584 [Dendrolimus kikuchii]